MPSKSLTSEYYNGNDIEENTDKIKAIRMYYTSNLMGKPIKNAVTGAEYPWCVGSKESKRLFKVSDVTSYCDKNGYVVKRKFTSNTPDSHKLNPSRAPNQCYYDSPKQYMQHRNVKLTQTVIDAWEKKSSEHSYLLKV